MSKLILFLVFGSWFILHGQNDFESGNAFYQKKDYSKAARAYETVLQSGKESAALHYNLGNCYYHLNRVGPSIYHLEKARWMDPSDEAIANNLNFARKKSLDTIPELPKVGFEKIIIQSTALFHYDTWGGLAIIFALGVVGSFLGYYFTKQTGKKRWYFSLMGISFLLLCIGLFAGFYQQNYFRNEHPAIVFSDKVGLYSEPTIRAMALVTLREGAKVYVLEKSGDWIKVRLTDDSLGWLAAREVREINPNWE